MHYKAVKTKLKLNNCQSTLMAKHAGFARWVYNWGLRLWREGYLEGLKPSANTLKKLFTNYVKPHFLWMSTLSSRGFGEFRRQLEYKCSRYGSPLLIADRFYPSSQLCSCCGIQQRMPLDVRVYDCINCELVIDRDLNAAINLCKCGRLAPGSLLTVNRSHAPDEAENKQQCSALSDVASVL